MPKEQMTAKSSRLVTARNLKAETSRWEERLKRSTAWAKPRLKVFETNKRWYTGMQRVMGHDSEGNRLLDELRNEFTTSINRLMPSLATQSASIGFQVPWFRARARRLMSQIDDAKRGVLERVGNYILQTDEAGFDDSIEDFILNFFLGYGTWKATYTPKSAHAPQERAPKFGEMVVDEDGIELIGGVPRLVGEKGEERMRTNEDGEFEIDDFNPSDLYQLESIYWAHLRHDPEGGRFYRNHAWTAQRMTWKLREFLDDKDEIGWRHTRDIEKAAKNIDDIMLREQSIALPFMLDSSPQNQLPREFLSEEDMDSLRLFGWEIWDHKNRKVEYLVDDHPLLVSPEDNDFPDWIGFSPYEFAMTQRIPGEWYPLTEVEFFIPTMKVYDLMHGKRVTHARRTNRKYEVAQHEVEADQLEFLKDPDDGVIIESVSGNAVKPIDDARVDTTTFTDMEIAIRDGNEIIGSTSESRGAAQADSATAAAIMERRGSSRELKKRQKIGGAMGRAVTKLFRGVQKTLPGSMFVEITGPDGEVFAEEVERVGIQGDVDFVVEIAEMAAGGDQVEQTRFMQIISLFGPSLMQEPEVVEEAARVFAWENPKMKQAILRHFQAIPTELLLQGPQGAGAVGSDTAGSAGEQGRIVGRISREAS